MKRKRNWKRIISNTCVWTTYTAVGFGVPLGFGITYATQNTNPWFILLCGVVIGAFIILTYPIIKLMQWLRTRTLKNRNLQADLDIKQEILKNSLNQQGKENLHILNNLNEGSKNDFL